MKTVVITGSARGFGFEMAKIFRKNNFNVVLCDLNITDLEKANEILSYIQSESKVLYYICDITKENDIENLISNVSKKLGTIDIWINNAGINQPDKVIWELTSKEIDTLLEIDLKGTIIASKHIMKKMIQQGSGAIYNVEGFGSNDAYTKGLSIYGTAKRAITYFTSALANECELEKNNIIVGKLSPGIMITDFTINSFRDQKIELSDKTKKVYNILGDFPDVVAEFLVNKVITNTKNDVRIAWLTNKKAAWRFMTSSFNKRDFFNN